MKAKIFSVLGALVTFVALTSASSACCYFLYQPKVPRNLK
ncbi:MAG: cyclic lactone autoinducer peptide [Clostridia bacterium]|nr:cyclic lactone autoinducer peptide [Clostridia bacterium]